MLKITYQGRCADRGSHLQLSQGGASEKLNKAVELFLEANNKSK
jgi:hypothetical protein